jgi:subtilisin family serine protease
MTYRILLAIVLVGIAASLSPADSIPGRIASAGSRPSETKPVPAADPRRQAALDRLAGIFPATPKATHLAAASGPGLGEPTARREMPKRDVAIRAIRDPQTGESLATGRLVVKFRDHLKFRAPLAPIDRPVSGADPAAADRMAVILAKRGATIAQWINRTPEQLATLEQRAVAHSGRAQPDLAGIMAVSFPDRLADADLEAVALEIQGLDSVEFVWVEQEPELHQCGNNPKPDPPVAAPGTVCNAPSVSCTEPPPSPPWDPSVTADAFACNDPTVPLEDRAGHWGCADGACCELVSTLFAACDDENGGGWDALCAAYANLVCQGTIFDNVGGAPPEQRYNPCFTDPAVFPPDIPTAANLLFEPYLNVISAPCGDVHPGRGCNLPLCCYSICLVDPFCCTESWDQNCVNRTADFENECGVTADPNPTPSYLAAQKYLSAAPIPVNQQATSQWEAAFFYRGQGLDVDGLLNLQQDLEAAYGLGPVLAHGQSIKVAVIEFSAFVNHEDFVVKTASTTPAQAQDPALWDLLEQPKVIPEPNQTILLIEGANNDPEHGTATLSQIVAAKQEDLTVAPPQPEVGGRGIAYNAQGYFFPIVSVEEGPRAQNAFVSCFEVFGPGDVTNNSWGFPPDGTIASVEPFNLLIRFGSDLGITTVCSAGNSSVRVRPQPLDSGAIVVGASTPGTILPGAECLAATIGWFGRLPFSNFTDPESEFDPDTGHQLGLVDVSAWGQNIFSAGAYPGQGFGYQVGVNGPFPGPTGNLFEANKLRTYTQGFSGTSGAGPIIAGAVALLQATAKQAFGGPLAPEQIRSVVSGWGREQAPLACSPEPDDEEDPFPPDCCQCGGENCNSFNDINVCVPSLVDAGIAIFTGGFPDGNRTEIKIVTGYPVNEGQASAIFIRALDGSYLRLGTEQQNAGTNVEGLAYLVTGPTTDVYAKLESGLSKPDEVSLLGLQVQGRSTSTVTLVGGFLYNYQSSRWDFIGVGFYGPATQNNPIIMPIPPYALEKYFGDGGVFRARVWTCGLGLSGPHQVWHDLIQISVNDPTFVPPDP